MWIEQGGRRGASMHKVFGSLVHVREGSRGFRTLFGSKSSPVCVQCIQARLLECIDPGLGDETLFVLTLRANDPGETRKRRRRYIPRNRQLSRTSAQHTRPKNATDACFSSNDHKARNDYRRRSGGRIEDMERYLAGD